MRANEKKIIQHYLNVAHNNLLAVKILNKQQPRSEQFPTVSQEEIAAQHEFSVLLCLARDLGVSNPYDFCEED